MWVQRAIVRRSCAESLEGCGRRDSRRCFRVATRPVPSDPLTAAYAPSKTFLNAVTVQYATKLSGTNILVNVCCPGYTATDLNDVNGGRTARGPTGGYFDDAGVVPW